MTTWYDMCVQDLERDYDEGLISFTEFEQERLTLEYDYKQAKLEATKRNKQGEIE